MKKCAISILAAVLLAAVGGMTPAQADTIKLKVNTSTASGLQRMAAEKFIELLSTKIKPNHQVKAEYFVYGEITTAGEVVDALKTGLIDVAVHAPSWASSWDERITTFDLPFLWKNAEQAQDYIIELGGGEKLGKFLIEKAGVRPLTWFSLGFRWMFFKDPIQTLDDLQKVKMRTSTGKAYLDMMRILDLKAVTVPWSEAFTALNTGLVNAVESAPAPAYQQRFHEVCKYAWPSNHMIALVVLSIREELFQKLPADVQQAMKDAAYETSYFIYGMTPMDSYRSLRKMAKETGLKVIYGVDPSPLQAKFAGYHDEWGKKYGVQDIIDEIRSMK